jgi:hypothetical protein
MTSLIPDSNNRDAFSAFSNDHRKTIKRAKVGFGFGVVVFMLIWLVGVLLSLAFTGVVIWAIIKLVNHYT